MYLSIVNLYFVLPKGRPPTLFNLIKSDNYSSRRLNVSLPFPGLQETLGWVWQHRSHCSVQLLENCRPTGWADISCSPGLQYYVDWEDEGQHQVIKYNLELVSKAQCQLPGNDLEHKQKVLETLQEDVGEEEKTEKLSVEISQDPFCFGLGRDTK